MKIVHVSDLHIGKSLYEHSLLEDQRHYLLQLGDYLQSEKADALLIAGDIYDRAAPSGDAVALLDEFLTRVAGHMNIPVLCIAGNHDSPNRLAFASGLYRESGLYMAACPSPLMDKVVLQDEWGEVHFYLLPFLTPAEARFLFPRQEIKTFEDAYRVMLAENKEQWDGNRRNVLLAHGYFMADDRRGKAIFAESEMPVGQAELVDAALLAGFDYVALGHLHSLQPTGIGHIRYSGSPLKYSISEAGQQKAALVVELGPKGHVEVTLHPFEPLRDLRIVEGSMEEILAVPPSQDYVYAHIHSPTPILNAMEKLRTVYPMALGLRMTDITRGDSDPRRGEALSSHTAEELFALFLQEVAGRPPSREETDWIAQAAQAARTLMGGGET